MPELHRGRPLTRASSTSKVSQLSRELASESHRSQSTQLPRKHHGNDELRHRAIKNEQSRRSSAYLDTMHGNAPPNKNIPMVGDIGRGLSRSLHSHKLNRRWAPLHPDLSSSEQSTEDMSFPFKEKNVFASHSDTHHPSTDDRGSLHSPTRKADLSTTQTCENSGSLSLTENLNASWRLFGNSSKVSSHASMSTLVPMRRYEIDPISREREEDKTHPEEIEEERVLATGDAEDIETTTMLAIFDIAREIQNFQNLVGKTDRLAEQTNLNRTQQRLLDLKQQHEERDSLIIHQLTDYAMKIEHEALLSTWTLIRLRFSSHITAKSKSQPECFAGVLGSIRRFPVQSTGQDCVSREDKDRYLLNMWLDEMHNLFDSDPQANRRNSYDGDDIYQGKFNSFNMSHMALRALESRNENRQE